LDWIWTFNDQKDSRPLLLLRHESLHFEDIRAGGYKSFSDYYRNPEEFWRLEFRGYMEEINMAREAREFDAGRELIEQMRNRRMDLLNR
jgi:hypothetical protein